MTLDVGTSSLRAMLFDSNARAVGGVESQFKYEMHATSEGGVEGDASELLEFAERAIDDVLARAGDRAANIAAVASDSLVSNLLGVDAEGAPLTPLYLYSDSRGSRQVDELRAHLDEDKTHQRVGTLFHTSYWPARLLWLAREHPDFLRRARYWMTLGEFFLLHWTGQRACSYSAAAWTGLLDRQKLVWDKELIAQLPIAEDQLSPLVDHDTSVGALRPGYASRWPALKDAAWFPAIGDGAAANVGSGCIDASRIALTIGTSSAMRVTRPCKGAEPLQGLPHGLWSYRVTRDRELVGGALSEGGNLFSWMRSVLHLDDSLIEDQVAALSPDAHGLTVLPFLAGERAPNWNADARGAIVGITLKTEPIEILRAGLESIAYRLGLVFQLLGGMAPNARQVIASGGALMNSPTWLQIIADTLGVPVIASAEPEATSRGAALLALKALDVIDSLDELSAELGTTYRPDSARHEIYARAMERQEKLYNVIVEGR